MDFWDKLSLHKNKIIAIIVFIATFYWLTIPELDKSDPYIIFIEYDCRSVIRYPSGIPKTVIEQCHTIIEEQHAPKAMQRSTRT